jgi:pimeloyl-ACP methyl ester carboxylesterase
MPGAPAAYRLIVPDMRGFGDSEFKPIGAQRGLEDWARDTRALLDALGVGAPPHLAGWSTGGAAIAAYAALWPSRR